MYLCIVLPAVNFYMITKTTVQFLAFIPASSERENILKPVIYNLKSLGLNEHLTPTHFFEEM